MMDDLQRMTADLAADPSSLVFLELGEALRRRRQLDAALAVGLGGLQRYPSHPDAHDLVGRIRSDRGEGDEAFDAWTMALRLDPTHLGALRGLAFLAFREGDMERAARHLRAALELAPDDTALLAAQQRVEAVPKSRREPASLGVPKTLNGLLADARGRALGGGLRGADERTQEAFAAELAGIMREAERAARMLGLGGWRGVAVECGRAAETVHLHLVPPSPSTVLCVVGSSGAPAGQVALAAETAAAAARRWLQEHR